MINARFKPHEIYYMERDYSEAIDVYESYSSQKLSPQKLLIVAKGYFILKKYDRCLEVINKIEPTHSPKILFERQSIMFRAAYLLSRTAAPSKDHLTFLRNILDTFNRSKQKTKGETFTKHHQKRIQTYMRFVDALQKNSALKINQNDLALNDRMAAGKKAKHFQGFPCYLVSQQWCQDLEQVVSPKGTLERYIGPLTNFQIVNDIFESYVYESPIDLYKNDFIFPGEKYNIVSKAMWNFYVKTFNESVDFLAVKRLYKKNEGFYSLRSSTVINELVPVAIECASKLMVIQITQNGNIEQELLETLESFSGLGQLKKKDDDNGGLEIIDLQIPLQKCLANANQIFVYEKLNTPVSIDRNKITPLLKFELNPIPASLLSDSQNGLKGFENLGNSCYCNSCLQCIAFTKEIVTGLTTTNILERFNFKANDAVVVCALADLLKIKWAKNDKNSVSPHKFKKYFGIKNPAFSGKTQEDAHEFLLCLLNNMHDQLKFVDSSKLLKSISKLQITTDEAKVKSYFAKHELQQNKSEITDLLRGIIHNTIVCDNCKISSHSYDVFLALSLPIPQKQTPSINIYFLPEKGKHTHKYEIYLSGLTNAADIFKIFQEQVFSNKGNDNSYLMVAVHHKSFQMEQILGQLNLAKGSVSVAIPIQQILTCIKSNDIVIYELKRPTQKQDIILVSYTYEYQTIGFPHFLVDEHTKIQDTNLPALRKYVSETDNENYVHHNDINQIEASRIKDPVFHKYKLVCSLRRRQKIFTGTQFIDKQLNASSEAFTLNDCFNMMRQPETLENSWKCGKCKSDKRGEKKEQIAQTNNILIISLKRFKADYRKIKGMVTYPVQAMDITEWIEEPALAVHKYDLYAVCLHQGTAEFGHYRAYCKHFVSGEWYEFDDRFVKKVAEADVVSPYAYMLFYRRRQP